MGEKWDVYDAPEDGARPETRAAAGEPLPSVIQEVGGSATVPVRRRTLVVGGVVLAIVVSVGAVLIARGADEGGPYEQPIAFAPTLVPARFSAFVTALEKRIGSTKVYSFRVNDGDYSVNVPPADKGGIPQSFFYYGDSGLRSSGDAGKYVVGRTFDLRTLDVAALERLYERAWHDAGGEVVGTSLAVEPPDTTEDHWVRIYVTHPGHGFYAVDGELDGTLVEGHLVD